MTVTTKTCTKCLRKLGLAQFYRSRDGKDGVRSVCKDCGRAATRQWNRDNPAKKKAGSARYYAENTEHSKAVNARWRIENAEKTRADHAAYYAENAEALKVVQSAWVARNRERVRVNQTRWNAENPEARRASKARYYASHTEEYAAYVSIRRALELGAFVGPIPTDIKAQMIALYGPTCMVPDCENIDLELDHIVPLSKGGAHAVDNFQLLCSWCNKSKGNRSSADYRPVKV